ncbi:MAG: hypothetical protein ABI448_14025 [Bacteroidia bacterium]
MSDYKLLGEIRLLKVKPQDLKVIKKEISFDEADNISWSLKGEAKIEGYGIIDIWLGQFPVLVNQHSAVFASIKEIDPNNNSNSFMGDATMKVHNVVSQTDGNIYLRVEIDWDRPLNAKISFLVFN